MGFVEKLRGEVVDIVEWIDDSRNTVVWRFPRYHNQIKNGARLIVRPGQSAVFVEQGRVADVFGPGTYELVTANLPVLSTIRGWKHGFDSPFQADEIDVLLRSIITACFTDLIASAPIALADLSSSAMRLSEELRKKVLAK